MKKKLFTILSAVVLTITLGYLFLLSWLISFLASKYIAGKSTGERGKVRSIVIPFRRWAIHLHHWLYSLFLVSLSLTTGTHFLTPEITYGLLGGLVFQGIYCYGDWHIILVSRHQTGVKERSVNTSKTGANSTNTQIV
jgi:hypothetical protein